MSNESKSKRVGESSALSGELSMPTNLSPQQSCEPRMPWLFVARTRLGKWLLERGQAAAYRVAPWLKPKGDNVDVSNNG